MLISFFDPVGGNGNNRVGNYLYVLGFTHGKTVPFLLAAYYVTRSDALDAMHPLCVLCLVRKTVMEFKATSVAPSTFPVFYLIVDLSTYCRVSVQ